MNIKYHFTGSPNHIFDSKQDLIEYYSHIADNKNVKYIEKNISEVDVHSEEYILRNIPEEFHSALSYMAYKLGHSYGNYEIRRYLEEFVEDLESPIRNFEHKIRDQYID